MCDLSLDLNIISVFSSHLLVTVFYSTTPECASWCTLDTKFTNFMTQVLNYHLIQIAATDGSFSMQVLNGLFEGVVVPDPGEHISISLRFSCIRKLL